MVTGVLKVPFPHPPRVPLLCAGERAQPGHRVCRDPVRDRSAPASVPGGEGVEADQAVFDPMNLSLGLVRVKDHRGPVRSACGRYPLPTLHADGVLAWLMVEREGRAQARPSVCVGVLGQGTGSNVMVNSKNEDPWNSGFGLPAGYQRYRVNVPETS